MALHPLCRVSHTLLVIPLVLTCLSLRGNPAQAEEVVELWRSAFGTAWAVAVDETDGSCWAATGNRITHLAADGTILSETAGFKAPAALSVNTSDHSCWVADTGHNEVVHLAASGVELVRVTYSAVVAVSVDSSTGGVWVGSDYGFVALLAPDGSQVWLHWDWSGIRSVAADPSDHSGWATIPGPTGIVHLDSDGNDIPISPPVLGWPYSIAVDHGDQTVWVADAYNYAVLHLASDGTELGRCGGLEYPLEVSVNASDHSCWVGVAGTYYWWYPGAILHLAQDCSEVLRIPTVSGVRGVAVNSDPDDGSCWIGEGATTSHLAVEGTELWQGGGFCTPYSVSAYPSDHSCWVADTGNNQIVQVSAGHEEAWRGDGFSQPHSVSVDPADGSCWVADTGNNQVAHLSAAHEETWRSSPGQFSGPPSVSASSEDGSCRAADPGHGELVSIGATHEELWRADAPWGEGAWYPGALSTDPSTGACWVADGTSHVLGYVPMDNGPGWWQGEMWSVSGVAHHPGDHSGWAVAPGLIAHFDAAGSLLDSWNPGIGGCYAVSVWPGDGSIWVTADERVVHYATDRTELWNGASFCCPQSVSLDLDPADGSIWVADTGNSQVVHLALTEGPHNLEVTAGRDPAEVESGCTTQCTAAFSDSRGHEVASWWWEDGGVGGSFSPSAGCQDPTYTALPNTTGDDIIVTLTVTGRCDGAEQAQDSASCSLTVHPMVAVFWTDQASGCAPLEVCFTDESTGAPTSWSWTFGDGGTSTLRNPCHTYTVPGSYTVSLEVCNACTCDTEAREGYISVGGLPTAAFSGSPTSGCASLPVCFTDGSTGNPTSWSWSFGDGGTSTLRDPCRTYTAPGSYTVSLEVCNACGCDTEMKPGYISVGGPPMAAFSGTPTSGCAPLEVCFRDGSTGSPTVWSWSFGDGGTSTAQNSCHTYPIPGSYTVSLEVCNACGCDTETRPGCISVGGPPTAAFSGTPTSGCAPLEVCFTDASGSSPTSWSWSFGDGGTSTVQNPCHTYQSPGTHTVSVEVCNACGCDTETKEGCVYVVAEFSDVPGDHWAHHHIMACAVAKIVGGYWDGTYRPALPVDRAAMAVFIARALAGGGSLVPTGPPTATFSDLPSDHWAYKYVEYLAELCVVGGYWDETYRPGLLIDRGQIAVFMCRAKRAKELGDACDDLPDPGCETPTFLDVPCDHWARKYVEYCAAEGIVTGYWDGSYRPNDVVTRDQMAVFIARAFELPI